MRCPFCSSENTRVVDKRRSENDNRRRRVCLKCGNRFTTYEKIEFSDLFAIKKDGRREDFDKNKLRTSILKACEKRPISHKTIEKIIDEIEAKIREAGQKEIETTKIGDMVMEKLKEIDEVAYVRFASYYKHFTDIASFEEELKKLKIVEEKETSDSTDLTLLVSTTEGIISEWNRSRITDALIKETNLSEKDADDIAKAVEKKIFSSGIKTISVSLIRELVNNELFSKGYQKKLKKQEIIGMPVYNINQIIFSKSNENANVQANNPEAVNLAIAGNALKQYALREVFSEDVANAHLSGALHLHNLDYIIRCYCSAHSLEYLKKYGLSLMNLSTCSVPAKHAMTLTGHLNTFLASMQAYYAGALGLAYVNIFYAPFLVGMDYKKMKQEAQYLIFSLSQNAFSRGGQNIFIDLNVHLGTPPFLKNTPAIGSKGKYMLRKEDGTIEKLDDVQRDANGETVQPSNGRILTYGDFEVEAQLFAKAMLDVWKEGDGEGKPFPFPKCNLHISQEAFEDHEQVELLKYACLIASENGAPYFVFDRDVVTLSACCRLRTKITDKYVLQHPESLRFCGFQNITINLPQAAYRAGKNGEENFERLKEEIYKTMGFAMKAHLQKKKFIEKMMGEGYPLWQVGKNADDGKPYINLEDATYIIGMIGLNECVKYMTGKEMHETDEAYKFGLKIISAMYSKAKEFEKTYNLKVCLEETPAESAALRFAKIDLRDFPESVNYIRGNKETGEIFYTNSIHFAPDAPIDIFERIEKQGKFNPIIEAGAITHVFLGEQKPDSEAIFSLVKKTWENTQSAQIVISPEFTVCNDCHTISRGYNRR